jgi:glycosyltransferase involved in cell wall biosynthesis
MFADDLRCALTRLDVEQSTLILEGGRPVRRLRHMLRTFRPDIVQAHGGEPLKRSAFAHDDAKLVYRRVGGAPATLHGGPRRMAYAALMRRATRVVAVADAVRDETLRLFGLAPDRVVTIPNAVDGARLRPERGPRATRDLLGVSRASRVVLSLGALTWEKDPSAHLAVAQRVLGDRADALHLIAGDGPLRHRTESTAAASPVADRIRFLGVRDDVADLLGAADVLLFASRPDGMEGMPGVLIEAGMSGVPVAGFDVAGASEVVANGVTGRLVPWGDADGLADAVLELFERGPSMAEAARTRCFERFSIDPIARRYLRLYEEVLSG